MEQGSNFQVQREPAKMNAGKGGLWQQGDWENGASTDG
jgi:hypothetical protein